MSLQYKLLTGLDKIQSPGTFASFNKLPPFDPQIHVYCVGKITLPLAESQAQEIIETAHRAPFGRGNETIVDTSVRRTWELNPGKDFEIGNAEWRDYIKTCCVRVAADLGIQTHVSAKLYKMLVYEKGAMFKAHTDTEKVPRMFGTLVICLPSAHEGGDVVVKHRGMKKTFKTSGYPTSFACWYSDVHHEVLPVVSGYRWVLTYNLVSDLCPTVDTQVQPAERLHETIKEWISVPLKDRKDSVVYSKLDHKYTQANISLDALKGRDKAQVQALQEISSELPVEIFLAVIEKEEYGNCEKDYSRLSGRRYGRYNDDYDTYSIRHPSGYHPLEDIFQRQHRILSMVNLNGDEIMNDMVFGKKGDTLLQEDFFSVTPEESYLGYQGNWGPEATHWYRVTAVAIVPRDSINSLILSSKSKEKDLASMISHFTSSLLHKPGDESTLNTLIDLYQINSKRITIPPDVITDLAKISFQSRRWDFFKKVISGYNVELSPDFFKFVKDNFPSESESFSFKDIQDDLSDAIRGYSSFYKQEAAVAFLGLPTVSLSDEMKRWVCKTHNDMLMSINRKSWERLDERDGMHLVSMAQKFYSFDYLKDQVIPIIERNIKASVFVVGFLFELFSKTDQGKFPLEEGRRHIKKTTKLLIDAMGVSTFFPKTRTFHKLMVHVFVKLVHLGYVDREALLLTNTLCQKIESGAFRIAKDAFDSFWLPFLQKAFPFIDRRFMGQPELVQAFQNMLGAILKAYISICLGNSPDPSNFVQNFVGCGCELCAELHDFFQDPSQVEQGYNLNASERFHVHRQLDAAKMQCTHLTNNGVLMVGKVDGNAQEREKWNKRRTEMINMLTIFDQEKLRLLLGEMEYEKIARLEVSVIPSEASTSDEASASPESEDLDGQRVLTLQPHGGVKRKIEHVDLTGMINTCDQLVFMCII